jgi:hypothetical protein
MNIDLSLVLRHGGARAGGVYGPLEIFAHATRNTRAALRSGQYFA